MPLFSSHMLGSSLFFLCSRVAARAGTVCGGKAMRGGQHVHHDRQNRPKCLHSVSVYGTWRSVRSGRRRGRRGSVFLAYPSTYVSWGEVREANKERPTLS